MLCLPPLAWSLIPSPRASSFHPHLLKLYLSWILPPPIFLPILTAVSGPVLPLLSKLVALNSAIYENKWQAALWTYWIRTSEFQAELSHAILLNSQRILTHLPGLEPLNLITFLRISGQLSTVPMGRDLYWTTGKGSFFGIIDKQDDLVSNIFFIPVLDFRCFIAKREITENLINPKYFSKQSLT